MLYSVVGIRDNGSDLGVHGDISVLLYISYYARRYCDNLLYDPELLITTIRTMTLCYYPNSIQRPGTSLGRCREFYKKLLGSRIALKLNHTHVSTQLGIGPEEFHNWSTREMFLGHRLGNWLCLKVGIFDPANSFHKRWSKEIEW